jgi:hypothetical protein
VGRPLRRKTIPTVIGGNRTGVRQEQRKPIVPGPWIYVGTFVGFQDPANDPADASPNSPPWLNNFYYVAGNPIAFRHGVDGQTDQIGMYDLTLGAVSGTIAFMMPREWANEMPPATIFPVELSTNIWSIATQTVTITPSGGEVRVFWPIFADPL